MSPPENSDRLLDWVRNQPQNRRVAGGAGHPVEIGQVRRLEAYDGQHPSRLVLVLDIADQGEIALVALAEPVDYCPTNRDIILSREHTDLPGGIAVMPDASASVWRVQLTGTPIHCVVSHEIVDAARSAPFLDSEELAAVAVAAGFKTGLLDCEPSDYLWNRRAAEAGALSRLASDCAWRVERAETIAETIAASLGADRAYPRPPELTGLLRTVELMEESLSWRVGEGKRTVNSAVRACLRGEFHGDRDAAVLLLETLQREGHGSRPRESVAA